MGKCDVNSSSHVLVLMLNDGLVCIYHIIKNKQQPCLE